MRKRINEERGGSKEIIHNTSEFIKVGQPPVKGPDLPFAIKNHCMVKINHSAIYIIGGHLTVPINDTVWKIQLSKQSWIINPTNNFQMREGPSLNELRSGFSCGNFKIGGISVIIVAGGFVNGKWLDSVEILDASLSLKWQIGISFLYLI